MNINVRNLLIVFAVFILFAWLENIEKKQPKNSLYEKYKKPLLFAAIVGLLLNLNLSNCTNVLIEDIKVISNSTQELESPTLNLSRDLNMPLNIPQNLLEKMAIMKPAINNNPEMYITLAKF